MQTPRRRPIILSSYRSQVLDAMPLRTARSRYMSGSVDVAGAGRNGEARARTDQEGRARLPTG